MEESSTVSSDITSEADDTVSLETAEIVNTESQANLRFTRVIPIPVVTSSRGNSTARLDEEVSILK